MNIVTAKDYMKKYYKTHPEYQKTTKKRATKWSKNHEKRRKEIVKKHQDAVRKRFRDKLFPFKNKPCARCGRLFPDTVMQFHHLNPKLKKFSITRGWSMKWTEVLKEIKKCIVVCANCHLIIEEEKRNVTSN